LIKEVNEAVAKRRSRNAVIEEEVREVKEFFLYLYPTPTGLHLHSPWL
jgi:hypothetical protein